MTGELPGQRLASPDSAILNSYGVGGIPTALGTALVLQPQIFPAAIGSDRFALRRPPDSTALGAGSRSATGLVTDPDRF